MDIKVTVTHTLSPQLEKYFNHFLQLVKFDDQEAGIVGADETAPEESEAGTTSTTAQPAVEAPGATKTRTRRTKKEIEDAAAAAVNPSAQQPAAPAFTVGFDPLGVAPAQQQPTAPVVGFDPLGAAPVQQAAAPSTGFDPLGYAIPVLQPAPVVTKDDCITAAQTKAQTKRNEVMQLIAAFGSTSVTEIPEARRAEFLQKVNAL